MSADASADGETLTVSEAIEYQEKLEEDTVAVLGASDPNNCSYPLVR